MNLNKIYLRYYPPGIALGYRTMDGEAKLDHIDLLDLDLKTNPDIVARELLNDLPQNPCNAANSSINSPHTVHSKSDYSGDFFMQSESEDPVETPNANPPQPPCHKQTSNATPLNALRQAIMKLQRKLREPKKKKFYLHKCLQSHILPLTNVCFDRSGERCLSGSYDRTCRMMNALTGSEEHVLIGHENVVFSVAYNFPMCDKVVTGSFDSSARVWSAASGQCQSTLYGHSGEVVSAEFNPLHCSTIVTASMDGTARIFHVETSLEMQIIGCHGAEVIAARFNREGNTVLTGSFDHSAAVWDIRSKSLVSQLRGHSAELSNAVWNFTGDLIATSSLDHTALVWDIRRLDHSVYTISDHMDEVLDVTFDYTGRLLATASSDCTARVWSMIRNNTSTDGATAGTGDMPPVSIMVGHEDEVSKVCFSPPGGTLLTASADGTARLWHTENGECVQVLAGHESDVFSCAFSYAGDMIITASKDNTCRLWR